MIRPVALLVDRQRAAKERLGLGEAVRGLEQAREIVEVGRHIRDDPARSSPRRSPARGDRAARPRRAGSWLVKQPREIVEVGRHIGMIRPIALLVDRERAAIERLGLGEAVRGSEQPREIVEAARDIGMIRPVALPRRSRGAAHERLGLGEAVRGLEQRREIVEADRHVG